MQKNNNNSRRFTTKLATGLLFVLCSWSYSSYGRLPFIHAFIAPENGLGGLTGKITGDLQPVGKVVITLMQKDKVIDKTETDDEGFYKFRYVAEGRYDIKAVKEGYRTCIVIKIPISPDLVTKLDFYQPKINNDHMPDHPIVETYDYYYKYMTHPDVSYPR